MQKTKSKTKIAVIAAILAVLAAGIGTVVFFFSNKTDSYRSILIYQLEGKAEIEREGTGTIAAANNLYLESGDRIRLDSDSSMRLKLDDDKYIMVEENSVLTIQAEGSDQDSKTSIHLEQGAVTNEIQNKLTDQSTYEVNSPNSIMAVRGTVFRAEGYTDEKGQIQTKISTFDGTVGFQPIAPDGKKQEEILIEAGKEAVIQSTADGIRYLKEPSDIAFSELPLQALHFLQDIAENGSPVAGITPDALKELIRQAENSDQTTPESTPQSPETDPDKDSVADNNSEPSGQNSSPEPGFSSSETGSGSQDRENPAGTSTGQPSPSSTPSGRGSPTKKPSTQNPATKTPSGQDTPARTPSGQITPTNTPSGLTPPTTTPSGLGKYTVTFMYEGKVFGVQTVENGSRASKPKLNPAPEGRWNFDFSRAIRENIEIHWIKV